MNPDQYHNMHHLADDCIKKPQCNDGQSPIEECQPYADSKEIEAMMNKMPLITDPHLIEIDMEDRKFINPPSINYGIKHQSCLESTVATTSLDASLYCIGSEDSPRLVDLE